MSQKSPYETLPWIGRNELDEAIDRLLDRTEESVQSGLKKRQKNVIDPFLSVLTASKLQLNNVTQLKDTDRIGFVLRSISNHMGAFHQEVLGSIDGWVNHDAGYDLECEKLKILAEVKNKHNTMNSTNMAKVTEGLETAITQKRGHWKAYLVQIIPKKPERRTESIGRRGDTVFQIDGASFYHIATGKPDAIHELFEFFCQKLSPSEEICDYCRDLMVNALPPRLKESQTPNPEDRRR